MSRALTFADARKITRPSTELWISSAGVESRNDWKGNGRIHGLWRDSHDEVRAFIRTIATFSWTIGLGKPGPKLSTLRSLFFPDKNAPESAICQNLQELNLVKASDSGRLMLLVSIAAAPITFRIV